MLRAILWPRKPDTSKTNEVSHGDTFDHEKMERLAPKVPRIRQQNNHLVKQINWNIPMNEELDRLPSASPDPQPSDQSRSTIPEPQGATPFEIPATGSRRTEMEVPQSNREPGMSRMSHPEEDSYALPQQSSSTAPRMIQQSSSGRTLSQNAFKRLRSMGSVMDNHEKLPALPPPGDLGAYGYPTTKSGQKKPEARYPGYRAYRATRCSCCLTTIVSIFLILCAVASFIIAVVFTDENCRIITVMIILMDLILLVIVVLEWIRLWLWREPISPVNIGKKARLTAEASMGPTTMSAGLPVIATVPGQLSNPTYPVLTENSGSFGGLLTYGFQQRLYDVPQFVSALCLIALYVIGALLIGGTMAAAGSRLEHCEILGLGGITYAAVLAILFCTRVVMCCMSDACRGLCQRTAAAKGPPPVPMVAENQLHQYLPGMGGYWHTGGETTTTNGQPTAWLVNLASATDPRQQLSMIRPMPAQYANDLTK